MNKQKVYINLKKKCVFGWAIIFIYIQYDNIVGKMYKCILLGVDRNRKKKPNRAARVKWFIYCVLMREHFCGSPGQDCISTECEREREKEKIELLVVEWIWFMFTTNCSVCIVICGFPSWNGIINFHCTHIRTKYKHTHTHTIYFLFDREMRVCDICKR